MRCDGLGTFTDVTHLQINREMKATDRSYECHDMMLVRTCRKCMTVRQSASSEVGNCFV